MKLKPRITVGVVFAGILGFLAGMLAFAIKGSVTDSRDAVRWAGEKMELRQEIFALKDQIEAMKAETGDR